MLCMSLYETLYILSIGIFPFICEFHKGNHKETVNTLEDIVVSVNKHLFFVVCSDTQRT